MHLMIETAIESGLRWGELTELRVRDLDVSSGVLTVTRAVLHLKAASHHCPRFVVKDYPKDKQWRQLRLADHVVAKLTDHISEHALGANNLLFSMPDLDRPRRRVRQLCSRIPRRLGSPSRTSWGDGTDTARRPATAPDAAGASFAGTLSLPIARADAPAARTTPGHRGLWSPTGTSPTTGSAPTSS
jgi:integrase